MIKFIIEHKDNISYIHKETGIRNQTISKKLDTLGVTERTNGRLPIYSKDENIFSNIDSNEKAYYLGLLAADGSLNKNSTLIRLSLHKDDQYLLEQFNAFMKSNRPIFQGANKNCFEVCINSKKIQEDLIKIGIGYNKSYTLKAPNIDDKFGKAFVLGLFDGDGSIIISNQNGYEHYEFRITGTKDILEYVVRFLYIEDNKYSIGLEHRCQQTYQLRIFGNYRVYKLLENLYKNNFDRPMKRKYDRFLRLQAKAPKKRNFLSKLS